MACLIAAPSSGSGKTLLSLVLTSWACLKGKRIQPFKVGPDYLDSQLLSLVSKCPCRNLDLILCGKEWVKDSFYEYGSKTDLTIVEGVMGLFDGKGSTNEGSSADIALKLKLPVILIIDAHGQAASIAALIKGFRDQEPRLSLAGVVLNNVNSKRHKELLEEVLDSIKVKLLGCLPTIKTLHVNSRNLGLVPAHEIKNIESRRKNWAKIAELYLDLKAFERLLQSPSNSGYMISKRIDALKAISIKSKIPLALAEDKSFHFRYPETKEFLEAIGFQIITWRPTDDEAIPSSQGLILPGGFPEQYAEELGQAKRSLNSLREYYGRKPIYAECGGMLLLGNSLTDLHNNAHPMAGVLPFNAVKGKLQVGYRKLTSISNSLILKNNDELNGHEFHRWEINTSSGKSLLKLNKSELSIEPPWTLEGWKVNQSKEGWSNKHLHASWIHLHWPSSTTLLKRWKKAFEN
tara:strand:+ start:5020 stop:6405 length:1386 start_codon:yes stop_codon:yes gene_type:complete